MRRYYDEDDEDKHKYNVGLVIFAVGFIVLLLLVFFLFFEVRKHEKEHANEKCPCQNYNSTINAIIEYENTSINLLDVGINNINAINYEICISQSQCIISVSANTGLFAFSITNTGPTNVTGDVVVYFSNIFVGFPPGTYTGTAYVGNTFPGLDQNFELSTYSNCINNMMCNVFLQAIISSPTTLNPGTYCTEGTFEISSNIVLDGLNLPSPSWIFNIPNDFTIDSGVNITVINTPNGCNVVFNTQGSAYAGVNSFVDASIFSMGGTFLDTGAIVTGKVVVLDGDLYTNSNIVNTRNCLGVKNCTASIAGMSPIPQSLLL